MFRQNVGGVDRGLRVTLGVLLVLTGLFLLAEKNHVGLVVAVVGVIVGLCLLVASLAFVGRVEATTTAPQNNVIVGSGDADTRWLRRSRSFEIIEDLLETAERSNEPLPFRDAVHSEPKPSMECPYPFRILLIFVDT